MKGSRWFQARLALPLLAGWLLGAAAFSARAVGAADLGVASHLPNAAEVGSILEPDGQS